MLTLYYIGEKSKDIFGIDKYEIIFVDDGSNDGTIEEIEKLKEKYKNIKIVERGYRKGLSSAFIDGVKHSNGKYIVLMDPLLLMFLVKKYMQ